MKKYTNQEKVRLAEQLLPSSYWEWLSQEYKDKAKMFETNIFSKIENEKDFIYSQGVLAGIKWCLDRPEQIKNDSEKILNRIMSSLIGV